MHRTFNVKKPAVLILFLLLSSVVRAGGIRGVIKGDDGHALEYATIFVKQTGTGAMTDLEGRYEVVLSPGAYDIFFQFLGFETATRSVNIGNDFVEMNVTLRTQALLLPSVTVNASKEDPAYTIMRKAIAKAKYHIQQLDRYTAKVYIKGKGKLTDYPWLAKKALEKEGITKDRLFISESVSEIKYTRPNKFEEKVIAVYTNGNNRNTSPNNYVFGSLYEPEIAETVSPLSPKSFSYYKFEYLGSFKDRTYEVSKIQVTPRSKGDNVFAAQLLQVLRALPSDSHCGNVQLFIGRFAPTSEHMPRHEHRRAGSHHHLFDESPASFPFPVSVLICAHSCVFSNSTTCPPKFSIQRFNSMWDRGQVATQSLETSRICLTLLQNRSSKNARGVG